MALKATIFKAQLNIADMDRHYYGDHTLTIARHPSENDARMMVRLLAFALNASEGLEFTRGISTEDEPDIWQKNLHGEVKLWIELGEPDERRLRKASGRASQVRVYCYQPRADQPWWQKLARHVAAIDNLQLFHLPGDGASQLAELASRNMQLQVTIQEGEVGITDGEHHLSLSLEQWQ